MNKFDELAIECQQMELQQGWKKLWTEVFSLEKIIIAIKNPVEEQDKVEPMLFVGSMKEAPCVFAFTDMEHFDSFQKLVKEENDDEVISYHELIIQDFLNATEHLVHENIPYIMMNYGNDYGFHTKNQEIKAMFHAFMDGEALREQRVEDGTMISVTVPNEIHQMKQEIEILRENYKNAINHVSPILVKLEERINLTLVIEFKGGLPAVIKKSIMQNLHKELSVSPLFQAQIHFTEEQKLISQEMRNIVQVKF